MKAVLAAARVCAAIGVCALLSECSARQSVSITNHYAKPIERVVIRDTKGIACSPEHIAPGATVKCPDHVFSEGKVTYEVTAADFSRSGLLGFVNAGGSIRFSLEIRPDAKVATGATAVGIAFGVRAGSEPDSTHK